MTCGRTDLAYTCGGGKNSEGACWRHFGSIDAFDAHMDRKTLDCLSDTDIRAKGYILSDKGVWKTPMDEAAEERLGMIPASDKASVDDLRRQFGGA